jgi:galactokinase
MSARVDGLLQKHQAAFGSSASPRLFQAPGRVNLLGEHTDYSGGFCMPAALSFNTLVAASPRADGLLRLHSMEFAETREFVLAGLSEDSNDGSWAAYGAGVAWSLMQGGVDLTGADLTLTGNVPLGAGLSSSASVEVATATALLGLTGVTMDGAKLALACQRAENRFVGAPCGIMDQYISANGRKGDALALDTRALTAELAPIPEAYRLVVANSMVKHSVGGGEYGTRRREVEEAARGAGVTLLRDATLAQLEAARGRMTEEAFLRGRHVITDSQRVLDGLAALRAEDVPAFGRLMLEAHASYRDDFAASCAECDLLVELAMGFGGCLGSRLTGGGFGGCTVSLVAAEQASSFADALRAGYEERLGIVADVYLCETADGAGEVSL